MAKRRQSRGKTGRSGRGKPSRADSDSPWKEALDQYFEPCIAFFFTTAHAEIDWSRGYEALDKELQPIVRQARQGRRYVDKLVKVWLKNGQEKWLLIHIEVQASKDREFARRMYVYNHRIFDRYDHEVVSLAILADDDPGWRPDRYEYGRWGFRALIEFPVVKLLDHAGQYEKLESDPNPFSVVVLAHLKALETRRSPAERQAWKVRLVKGLYGRGMGPEDLRRLFRFIDWIMELPEALEERFQDEITAYQQENKMPFIDIFERKAIEKARAEGLEQGLKQGIEAVLETKFGAAGLELMPEIRQIRDPAVLGKVLARLRTAARLDEVRTVWTRKRRPKAAKPD